MRKWFCSNKGWLDMSEISYIDLAKQMEKLGVQTVVFTDISKDGTLAGPNFEQLKSLQNSVDIRLIASGGVASIQDVKIKCYEHIRCHNWKGFMRKRLI